MRQGELQAMAAQEKEARMIWAAECCFSSVHSFTPGTATLMVVKVEHSRRSILSNKRVQLLGMAPFTFIRLSGGEQWRGLGSRQAASKRSHSIDKTMHGAETFVRVVGDLGCHALERESDSGRKRWMSSLHSGIFKRGHYPLTVHPQVVDSSLFIGRWDCSGVAGGERATAKGLGRRANSEHQIPHTTKDDAI
jgi:hypothetical protein